MINTKMATVHPSLRFAALRDIPRIMELGNKLYSESPYTTKLSQKKIRAGLEKAIIEGQRKFLVLLSYVDDEVVGALVAYAYEPLFSDETLALEVLWYLEPAYRASHRAVEMMDAYEYWAKGIGCAVVQYGILSGVSAEGMARLYESRGMVQTEQIYTKVL